MAIKITFLGAGSSVFVRNVLGDCIIHPELEDLTFALYDICLFIHISEPTRPY